MHTMSNPTMEAVMATPTMYEGDLLLGDIDETGLDTWVAPGAVKTEELGYGNSDATYVVSTIESLHSLTAYSLYERI